jgi:hypothetical protein
MGSGYVPSAWPVDPERLPWWQELDPEAPCRWRSTRIPRVRALFLVASGLWVAFAIFLLAVQDPRSAELLWCFVWPTVVIFNTRLTLHCGQRRFRIVGCVYLGMSLLARAFAAAARADRTIASVRDHRVFGNAGAPLAGVRAGGERRWNPGCSARH